MRSLYREGEQGPRYPCHSATKRIACAARTSARNDLWVRTLPVATGSEDAERYDIAGHGIGEDTAVAT